MVVLNRYIGRTVALSVAVTLLLFVGLDAVSAIIDELDELKGEYRFVQALVFVGLSLPARIYEQMSMSALVGCLFALGSLASNGELTVMRAAGVSMVRLLWAVMRPLVIYLVLAVALADFVTPVTNQLADTHRALAQGEHDVVQARSGLWTREQREFIHINAVLPNGVLYGVTRYQFDAGGILQATSFVERATYQKRRDGSEHYWLEEQGRVSELSAGGVVRSEFATRRWHSEMTPTLLNVLVLPPEALSLRSLSSYTEYLQSQGLDSREYRLAYWQKLLYPLAAISLVLVAASFIFGPLREATMGYRIFIGVVVGIVFNTSQNLLGPSSLVFGFAPWIAVATPIAVCMFLALVLLARR